MRVRGTIFLNYYGVIYSKKNNKRIITDSRTGKPRITSNDRAKEQEMAMAWAFREQGVNSGWFFPEEPKEYAGRKFILNVSIWQKDRVRRDLDNQLTAILDGLVAGRVLPDDSNKFVTSLAVVDRGVDKENPRAEIAISEIEYE